MPQDLLQKHLEFLSPKYKAFLNSGFIEKVTQSFIQSGKLLQNQVESINESLLLFAVFLLSREDLVEVISTDLDYSHADAEILTNVLLEAFPIEFLSTHATIVAYFQSDDTLDKAVYATANTHGLQTAHQKAILLEIVEEVISGTKLQAKLPELVMKRLELPQAQAFKITADLIDVIDHEQNTVPINNPEPTNDNSLANEIAEAEATMQTLEPIKTMSHDMEVVRSKTTDEPVHSTASQADLLDHAAAVKEKNPDSRWNTEQS
jgi:hypothetical protein